MSCTISCQETGAADCLNSVSWRDGSTQAVKPGTTSSQIRICAFFSVQVMYIACPRILIYWGKRIGFHKNSKNVKRQHPVMFKRRLEEDEPENTLICLEHGTKVWKWASNTARKTLHLIGYKQLPFRVQDVIPSPSIRGTSMRDGQSEHNWHGNRLSIPCFEIMAVNYCLFFPNFILQLLNRKKPQPITLQNYYTLKPNTDTKWTLQLKTTDFLKVMWRGGKMSITTQKSLWTPSLPSFFF